MQPGVSGVLHLSGYKGARRRERVCAHAWHKSSARSSKESCMALFWFSFSRAMLGLDPLV